MPEVSFTPKVGQPFSRATSELRPPRGLLLHRNKQAANERVLGATLADPLQYPLQRLGVGELEALIARRWVRLCVVHEAARSGPSDVEMSAMTRPT